MFKTQINDNLSLKILEDNDTQALFDMIENSREYLSEWIPFVKNVHEPKDINRFIKSGLNQFAENNGFHCGIWYNNKLVCVIGLLSINWTTRKTSIGYYLDQNYQKLGIITTCLKFLIDYCFTELNLNKIEIKTSTNNIKSQKIPMKLGFKKEGTLRHDQRINDQYLDSDVFGLLKIDYIN